MSQLTCNKPVYYLSLSDNSSGYKQMLREKNLQLTELQFYTKNKTRCQFIVALLYSRIQYYQWYTLIKCATIFTTLLSIIHNSIQQASDTHQNFRALYNPNQIFIPRYVFINQHTLRPHLEHQLIHWIHHNSYFTLALCDTNWLSHYTYHHNQIPICPF